MKPDTHRHRIARWVARWIIMWHVLTIVTFLALIVMTLSLWPATSLTIQISVLVTGFFSAMGALAAALMEAEDV